MSKDYSHYQDADGHANSRDRKNKRKHQDRLMRGNRSVFEIQKAQAKRDRNTRKGND